MLSLFKRGKMLRRESMGKSLNRWYARDLGDASWRAVSCPKEVYRCLRLVTDDFC
jgi:hypothetical protein